MKLTKNEQKHFNITKKYMRGCINNMEIQALEQKRLVISILGKTEQEAEDLYKIYIKDNKLLKSFKIQLKVIEKLEKLIESE